MIVTISRQAGAGGADPAARLEVAEVAEMVAGAVRRREAGTPGEEKGDS